MFYIRKWLAFCLTLTAPYLSLSTQRWKTGLNIPVLRRSITISAVPVAFTNEQWSFSVKTTLMKNSSLHLQSLKKHRERWDSALVICFFCFQFIVSFLFSLQYFPFVFSLALLPCDIFQHERSRVIYKYALDNLPKEKCEDIYKAYTIHEKKYGDRTAIEDVIVSKRKFKYEEVRLSCVYIWSKKSYCCIHQNQFLLALSLKSA